MSLSKVTSVGGEPLGGYRKQERAGTAQRTGKEGSMRAMERCGEAGKGTWRSKGSVGSRSRAGQGTRRQQGRLEAAGGQVRVQMLIWHYKRGAMCNNTSTTIISVTTDASRGRRPRLRRHRLGAPSSRSRNRCAGPSMRC